MVVSLESQKVKVKKSYYLPKRDYGISFGFLEGLKKVNLKSIGNNYIIVAASIIILVIIFSGISKRIIFNKRVVVDINAISFPEHIAEVGIRKQINDFTDRQRFKLYQNHSYSGEALSSIAIKYGVSLETILHVNNIEDIRDLKSIDSLIIPAMSGIQHTVSKEDSLEKIFETYSVPIKEIFRVNSLKSENLVENSKLFIPGIKPSSRGFESNIDKFFIYPVKGNITKRFGEYINGITGLRSSYEGIDFVPTYSSNVYSSKAGQVSKVGYNSNYGNYIFIDHPGGYRTLYAHLDRVNVSIREKVTQDTLIGTVGRTGYARSKKLFFCLLNKHGIVDPEKYLK